jgi:hypothetical protein
MTPVRNAALTGRGDRWHRPMTMTGTNSGAHTARLAWEADVETVTEIVTRSFAEDPVWGAAYPPEIGDGRRAIWRL